MRKFIQIAPGMGNWIDAEPSSICVYFGSEIGETVDCPTCKGRVSLKVFRCGRYGRCTPKSPVIGSDIACCNGKPDAKGVIQPCPGYQSERKAPPPRVFQVEDPIRPSAATVGRWAIGVTTVRSRRDSILPRTLKSLRDAGFDKPRLFVDGDAPDEGWAAFGLEATFRYPQVRTAANWTLSAWEIYAREPLADRYAIFQDDLIACRNLRAYLDRCPYPDKGYWNLLTFPSEQARAGETKCWYVSNQNGRGAVALVFSREALTTLLAQPHLVERPQDANRGYRAIDGGIVAAMNKAGWKEYVHNPSLVQHVGDVSSMGNNRHPAAPSFPGENFDALSLLG